MIYVSMQAALPSHSLAFDFDAEVPPAPAPAVQTVMVREHPRRVRAKSDAYPSPPSVRHSETSVAAAEAFAGKAPSVKAQVYDWLKSHGPATDEEIAAAFPERKDSTTRARRVELTRGGQVFQVKGTQRKSKAGLWVALWAAI